MAAAATNSQGHIDPSPPPPQSTRSSTRPASSTTALQSAKTTLTYLIHSTTSPARARLRTRALLRTVRYVSVFIFWRLVRYAKYVAVGSIAAAVAGTALGSVLSGAAFLVAPTGILGGASVGLLWGLGKFGWRTLARRVGRGETHGSARADERREAEGVEEGEVRAPRADPW